MPVIRSNDLLTRLVKDVNDIRSALRRTVANLPLFDIDNENTPAQLTADQNNYVPGNYDVLRLSSSQAVNITGMSGGIKGRKLKIFNDGDYPITLIHQSGLSSLGNRFRFSSRFDSPVPPQASMVVYYDESNSVWVDADRTASGVVMAETLNVASQSVSTVFQQNALGAIVRDRYGFVDLANNKITIAFSGVYIIDVSYPLTADPFDTYTFYGFTRLNGSELRTSRWTVYLLDEAGSAEACYVHYLSRGDYLTFHRLRSSSPVPSSFNLVGFRVAVSRIF